MFTITYADDSRVQVELGGDKFHVRTFRPGATEKSDSSGWYAPAEVLGRIPSGHVDDFREYLLRRQNTQVPAATADLIVCWHDGDWTGVVVLANELRRDAEAARLAKETLGFLPADELAHGDEGHGR